MRDLHNNVKAVRALSPGVAVTNNTAFVSEIIDRLGYNSLEFLILTGSIADGDVTFTTLLEDGDAANLSDNVPVADAYLLGTEAGATPLFTDDNKVFKLGYNGNKRYCRLTITPAANSGDVYISAVAVLGHPAKSPVA